MTGASTQTLASSYASADDAGETTAELHIRERKERELSETSVSADCSHSSRTIGAQASPQPLVSASGQSFSSPHDVLLALEAALEVNDHLRTDVELKGNQVEDMRTQIAALEHRHEEISAKLKAATRQEDDRVEEHVATVDKRMDYALSESLAAPATGVWNIPMVARRKDALVERGAAQGWLIPSQDLKLGRIIGAGTFGQTYEADWRGVRVAAKCTRPPESSAEAINCLREVECFASLTHPHVLPFLGACLADTDNCLLVTEFMTGGTLKEWLYGSLPAGRKPWHALSLRLEKGLQVAQGMAALEAVDPPIAHRDLKPSNIFLDSGGQARVADMNLSVRLHPQSLAAQTAETGTYLYMSPEMMRHEAYTTKTDVWSFGVMLVELCNRQLPYSHLYLTPLQVAVGVADRKLSPSLDHSLYPPQLLSLIDSCLQQDAATRPHFIQIVPQLKQAVSSVRRVEEQQEASKQASLLGRMSGMFQGVTAQAAAGLRGDASGSMASGTANGQTARQRPPAAAASPGKPPRTPPPQQAPSTPPQRLPQMRSTASSLIQGWMGRGVRRD